jgi:hypothetical protein
MLQRTFAYAAISAKAAPAKTSQMRRAVLSHLYPNRQGDAVPNAAQSRKFHARILKRPVRNVDV